MNISDYQKMDAIDLASGIRSKQFSCLEVTNCAIEQATSVNPAINAVVSSNYEQATSAAKSFDSTPALLQSSKVAGLPFLIKDLSAVKGLPAGNGSELFRGYVADKNHNIAQKYVDAGLVILGKTNTPEFGLTLTTEPQSSGVCRNPWNTDYSTGGSSGGAAAAVAAGIIPVAHATDGGGSIRIPAACCGVFGLKPSRGLTAVEDNLGGCWSGMSVGHVVSQSVRDSAAFLDLIKLDTANLFALPPAPKSFFDAQQLPPRKLRIGIQLQHPLGENIDDECLEAVRKAAGVCESLGHEIEEVGFAVDYGPVASAMSKMINLHVYQAVQPRLEALDIELEDAPLETSTRIMASKGRNTLATDYVAALDTVKNAERQLAAFHQQVDVIISPVLSKVPAKIAWLDMNSDDMRQYSQRFKAYSGFTAIYNGTGQPSMSMPLHRSSANIPVGVMFTAAWGADSLLLQLAAQIEQTVPWQRHAAI